MEVLATAGPAWWLPGMEVISPVTGIVELYGDSDDQVSSAASMLASFHSSLGKTYWVDLAGEPPDDREKCTLIRPQTSEAGIEAALRLLAVQNAMVVLHRLPAVSTHKYSAGIEILDSHRQVRALVAHMLIQARHITAAYQSCLLIVNELRYNLASSTTNSYMSDLVGAVSTLRIRSSAGVAERKYAQPWRYTVNFHWSGQGRHDTFSAESYHGIPHSRGWQFLRAAGSLGAILHKGSTYYAGSRVVGRGKEEAVIATSDPRTEAICVNTYMERRHAKSND